MATVGDALALAARNFPVFPLRPNDWRPAIKDWQKLATTDEATIRRWWTQWPDANVGVATGKGLLVVDIDNKKGKNGSQSFADLDLPFEALDTFTVSTPSGGRHVYYRIDGDARNTAELLGPGIDTRGDGGYVVGPGSTLTDGAKDGQPGGKYNGMGLDNPLRSAPDTLSSRLLAHAGRDRSAVGRPLDVSSGDAAAERYLRGSAPIAVQGKGGDHTTFVVAAQLKDLGIDEFAALDLLLEHWNERCEPPWAPEDLKTKVANAYRYGENPPGSKSPEVMFSGVDVQPPPVKQRVPSRWLDHGAEIDRDALWLFPDIAPATGVCVCVAPSQAGKTFVLLEMARCVATGKPFFKIQPDDTGATLIVYAGTEGSGFARRLAALQEDTALPISGTTVGNLAERGALDQLLVDLKTKAAEMLERFGVPVRLIVVETIAASNLLNDENSNVEASRAIANLGQISLAMNALVVTSHHPSKDGKRSRGASAITDNADYVFTIERSGRDKVRKIELTKARDAEQRDLGSFSLVPVDLGKDSRGRPITSMTVSMGDVEAPIMRAAKHAPMLIEAIEWAVIGAGREIDGKMCVKKTEVWTVFDERCKTPTDRSNKHKAYKAAFDFLESQGAVVLIDHGKDTYIYKQETFL